tara:strand:- start:137 stop:355 length:219 start_codon:yes stop_codon:yes gene_type:complete
VLCRRRLVVVRKLLRVLHLVDIGTLRAKIALLLRLAPSLRARLLRAGAAAATSFHDLYVVVVDIEIDRIAIN